MIIPTKDECLKILAENNVPANVIAHSKKVHEIALRLCDIMEKKGTTVNRDLAGAGALLHDIVKINDGDHVLNGQELVRSLGFPEVARIIGKHGLVHIDEEGHQPKTIEEKIVFYADKRVKYDRIVSLKERFQYIKKRYKSPSIDKELEFTKRIEKELLGDGNLDQDIRVKTTGLNR